MLGPGRHRAPVLAAERAFCCAGCEAVARTSIVSWLASSFIGPDGRYEVMVIERRG